MSNAWDTAKAMAEKHASEGIFVRLANDKDKVTGVFVGEPYAREVVWNGERYEPADANNAAGKKPVLRVAMNLFVLAEGAMRVNAMKVIEGGSQWFADVLKMRETHGLDSCAFTIERRGAAGDTKTRYVIAPGEPIADGLHEVIAGAPLHDLARVVVGDFGDDDAAVDARTAEELVVGLRAIPRDEVDKLLAAVGAKRVREVKARDVPRLREAINGAMARANEIDPFA